MLITAVRYSIATGPMCFNMIGAIPYGPSALQVLVPIVADFTWSAGSFLEPLCFPNESLALSMCSG